MNCDELQDHYALFALGLAEEPERSEIRAHLARRCEVCEASLGTARELGTLIGAAAAPASPSPHLRRRILAAVGYEKPQFRWAPLWAAVAGLSLIVAALFVNWNRQLGADRAGLRAELERRNSELSAMNDAMAIVNGVDTTEASFGQGPKGRVFVNPRQGVLLIASNLPPAPRGKTYEMWIVPKSGKPAAAGLFQPAADGRAMHLHRGAMDVAAAGAIAVTLENEGGAEQPTTQPLIVAALR